MITPMRLSSAAIRATCCFVPIDTFKEGPSKQFGMTTLTLIDLECQCLQKMTVDPRATVIMKTVSADF